MKDDTKNIEHLVDKMMTHDQLQSPSHDFTSKVMAQVETKQSAKVTTYKPLISKPVWAMLGLSLVAIIAFAFFDGATPESSWLPQLDFDNFFKNGLSNYFSKVNFSGMTMYALLFFAFMLCVQIPVLKRYLDHRLDF